MYVSYLSHSPPTPLISKEKRRLMRSIIKLFYSHTDTASNNAHSNDMKVKGQDTHHRVDTNNNNTGLPCPLIFK